MVVFGQSKVKSKSVRSQKVSVSQSTCLRRNRWVSIVGIGLDRITRLWDRVESFCLVSGGETVESEVVVEVDQNRSRGSEKSE